MKKNEHQITPIERVAATLGFLLLGFVVVVLLREGFSPANNPPDIRFKLVRIHPFQSGALVQVEASNQGDRTAAQVKLRAAYRATDSSPVEEKDQVVDYLPPHSRRTVGFFFDHPVEASQVKFSAEAFVEP